MAGNKLTKGHLEYMNIGRKYWGGTRENLTQKQSRAISTYLKNAEQNISEGVGFFLWGENGSGKTYISAVMCKTVWGLYGLTSYCVTTDELKESFIDRGVPAHFRSEEKMCDRVRVVPFLVIDDLGKEYLADSGFFESRFGSLLRFRGKHNLVTSFTTNMAPAKLKGIYGESTVALLQESCLVQELSGENIRTKIARDIESRRTR